MRHRLAAILSADMVGYSRQMAEDEAATLAALRTLRDKLFEPVVIKLGGEVFKRLGDGWLVSFDSAIDAVTAAVEVQNALLDHPHVRLRIGVHLGDVVEEVGDLFGDGVNVAARLQAEAEPGGILISDDLHRQLSGKSAPAFTRRGPLTLKNIPRPILAYAWRPEGLRAPAVSPGSMPLILVEPFPVSPADGETPAFAEELRDAMTERLSRRTGVRISAPDSPQDEDRSAEYRLRGRVRKLAGRYRVNCSLRRGSDGEAYWTQGFDGSTDDPFALIGEIVDRTDVALRLQINAYDARRLEAREVHELNFAELLTLAAALNYGGGYADMQRAATLIDRAIVMEPDDPMALAMRADCGALLVAAARGQPHGQDPNHLRDLANRAIELLGRSDYAFYARCNQRLYGDDDAHGALEDARRALALTPTYPLGLEAEGVALLCLGRAEEGAAKLEKAIALSRSDPTLFLRSWLLAIALFCAGRLEAAAAAATEAAELRPTDALLHRGRAAILLALGDEAGARRSLAASRRADHAAQSIAMEPPLKGDYAALWTQALNRASCLVDNE